MWIGKMISCGMTGFKQLNDIITDLFETAFDPRSLQETRQTKSIGKIAGTKSLNDDYINSERTSLKISLYQKITITEILPSSVKSALVLFVGRRSAGRFEL